MPSNHLNLCHPLLLLPSVFPSIRVFSNELALCIRWPKYWSFSLSISPANEYSGSISFRIWGRMDTCICMVESLHCLPEAITTLFVNQLYCIKSLGGKKSHYGKQFDKNLLEFRNSVVSDPLLKLQK